MRLLLPPHFKKIGAHFKKIGEEGDEVAGGVKNCHSREGGNLGGLVVPCLTRDLLQNCIVNKILTFVRMT